jgi:uncharacterized damage-inducible protein DinB
MPVTASFTHLDRAHVTRMLRFHHWAEDAVFAGIATLTAQELDMPWGGSFGTGRAMLAHIIGAERLWCDRWYGRTSRPQYPATHSGADFRDEWARVRTEQRTFIDALSQEALSRDLNYVNMRGDAKSFPLDDLLIHVVNHGTYHRGQMTQLLRDRGRDVPGTDFIVYMERERAGSA